MNPIITKDLDDPCLMLVNHYFFCEHATQSTSLDRPYCVACEGELWHVPSYGTGFSCQD